MLKDGEGTVQDRARRLADESDSAYVQQMVAFILGDTDRNFLTPGG
jgi:UDP-N-acetylglucosamine acyltransferase